MWEGMGWGARLAEPGQLAGKTFDSQLNRVFRVKGILHVH
jgi:hypothetical protein